MNRLLVAVTALALLSACGDGQPFFQADDADAGDGDGTDTPTDPTDGVDALTLPPGTLSPSPNSRVIRFEPENDDGGGLIISPVIYDADNDTFTVDNLAFDGDNVYQRGTAVASLNSFAVYDAEVTIDDQLSGGQVSQLVPYRAILGVSQNTVDGKPRSSFAIVRTGGYVQYGFGGFVYEREGGVVLPTSGQATYSGDYAGLRVFNGEGGLLFTEGDMTLDIDFDDFNPNEGIKGRITNRRQYDETGAPEEWLTSGDNLLPVIRFVVEYRDPGVNDNGEAVGEVFSTYDADAVTPNGVDAYETGTYYAILSGDHTDPADGGEVTGVMVLETSTALEGGSGTSTVQETGGFILYR